MKIASNVMHPVQTSGNQGLEAAIRSTSHWNENCKLNQTLYRVVAGMPLGTMATSMRAESWEALSEAVVPMYTNEENVRLQQELGDFLSAPAEVSVANVVAMAGEMPSAPTDIISQVGGTPIDDQAAAAWMIEMSEYANQVTGAPNILIQHDYGVPGGTFDPRSMAIVTYHATTAEHEEATNALRADEGYLRRMSRVSDLFDMSSYFNILMRKII